jgi:hypothetical protein
LFADMGLGLVHHPWRQFAIAQHLTEEVSYLRKHSLNPLGAICQGPPMSAPMQMITHPSIFIVSPVVDWPGISLTPNRSLALASSTVCHCMLAVASGPPLQLPSRPFALAKGKAAQAGNRRLLANKLAKFRGGRHP